MLPDVPKLTFASANLLLLFIASCLVDCKLDVLFSKKDDIFVELAELYLSNASNSSLTVAALYDTYKDENLLSPSIKFCFPVCKLVISLVN